MTKYSLKLFMCVGLLAFCGAASAAASSPAKESKREKVSGWLSRVWGDITGAKGGTQEEGDDTIVVSPPSSPEKGLEQKENIIILAHFDDKNYSINPRYPYKGGVGFERGYEILHFDEDQLQKIIEGGHYVMSNVWPLQDRWGRSLKKEIRLFSSQEDAVLKLPKDLKDIAEQKLVDGSAVFYLVELKKDSRPELDDEEYDTVYTFEPYRLSNKTKQLIKEKGLRSFIK